MVRDRAVRRGQLPAVEVGFQRGEVEAVHALTFAEGNVVVPAHLEVPRAGLGPEPELPEVGVRLGVQIIQEHVRADEEAFIQQAGRSPGGGIRLGLGAEEVAEAPVRARSRFLPLLPKRSMAPQR